MAAATSKRITTKLIDLTSAQRLFLLRSLRRSCPAHHPILTSPFPKWLPIWRRTTFQSGVSGHLLRYGKPELRSVSQREWPADPLRA
jgi:hypothetical protein